MNTKGLNFRERACLDDMLEENPLWEEMYEEVFVGMMEMMVSRGGREVGALKVLEQVERRCVEVLQDAHPEDMFATKFLVPNPGARSGHTPLSVMVVSLSYVVLSLSQHSGARNVRHFLRKVERLSERYAALVGMAMRFVQGKGEERFTVHFPTDVVRRETREQILADRDALKDQLTVQVQENQRLRQEAEKPKQVVYNFNSQVGTFVAESDSTNLTVNG